MVPRRGRPGLGEIHGEGADHPMRGGLDRKRPDGPVAVLLGQRQPGRPQRIRPDVRGDHRPAGVDRQPAGQRLRANPETVDAGGVVGVHAGHWAQLLAGGIGQIEGAANPGALLRQRGAD